MINHHLKKTSDSSAKMAVVTVTCLFFLNIKTSITYKEVSTLCPLTSISAEKSEVAMETKCTMQ